MLRSGKEWGQADTRGDWAQTGISSRWIVRVLEETCFPLLLDMEILNLAPHPPHSSVVLLATGSGMVS